MLIPIVILIVSFIIYFKYIQINEGFNEENISFFSLNKDNYQTIPNDHYFYDNPPLSDDLVLGKRSQGRFCVNNKIIPYREQNYFVSCSQPKDGINNLFRVDVDMLAQKFKKKSLDRIEEFNKKTDEEISADYDKLIKRYSELQDEILYSERFLEENKFNADQYRETNQKLQTNVDETNFDKNKKVQTTLTYKDSYNDLKRRIKTLHGYAKYVIICVAIMTLIYLFNKKYQSKNNNISNKLYTKFNNNSLVA
jgi:hypothetical protein